MKDFYQPGSAEFVEVHLPPRSYLAIDGHGDPNTSRDYADAVAALFAISYAVKFALRARTGEDFVVGPLEGLWTSEDPTSFTARRKGEWDWTMLIPLPDVVTTDDVDSGLASAARKKPELPVGSVRLLVLDEGRCLQIMHVGSYDDEGPTLARLHQEVMPEAGVTFNGPHHEIYLSDPRRVAPEKLRTVLRQPVRPI
nr:GyrI-like domain-containing protein [Ornithinimicrobium sp. F0845]